MSFGNVSGRQLWGNCGASSRLGARGLGDEFHTAIHHHIAGLRDVY